VKAYELTEVDSQVVQEREEIPQEWINGLIDRQDYWVYELVRHCG
jgi:hypothetical protein